MADLIDDNPVVEEADSSEHSLSDAEDNVIGSKRRKRSNYSTMAMVIMGFKKDKVLNLIEYVPLPSIAFRTSTFMMASEYNLVSAVHILHCTGSLFFLALNFGT